MESFGDRPRERFRAFPLDGALLFFQPSSGTNIRVENERTRGAARCAPRVVMFGITNHCNLSCSFCSRDTTRESAWTVKSAAAILTDLERAGSLEVAFGGGEPFAFRGFAELIAELHANTRLALNVTTNGTLLNDRSFAPFRGKLGQVRVSIYDDAKWLPAARALRDAGQLWGANVLVHDQRLAELPALLAQLTSLGCHDVSLLRYVGPDLTLQLSTRGRARLVTQIADAPLPCRISVCFGDALRAERLFDGADGTGDCGAGHDFVSITPDRTVQSCSFQSEGHFAATADEVLSIWRTRRAELGRASARPGCARRLPRAIAPVSPRRVPEVAVWRGFSGNNSGECILVAKFDSHEDAERFFAELSPSWAPDDAYSDEWQALFQREHVALAALRDSGEPVGQSPSQLLAIGRSVIAVGYDSGDAFPELRALAWKRAGFVVPGGIHLHEPPSLLGAIRCRDKDDAEALIAKNPGLELFPHGALLFAHSREEAKPARSTLEDRARMLVEYADGRPLGAEFVLDGWDESAFLAAKQRLGGELQTEPRLLVSFWGAESDENAARFAKQISEGTVHVCHGAALVEGLSRRKRAAVLALRQGGAANAIDGREVEVSGYFWFLEPPRQKGTKAMPRLAVDVEALRNALTARLNTRVQVEPQEWTKGATASVVTDAPALAFAALASVAKELGTQVHPAVRDRSPLDYLLRRLIADVSA